MAFSNTGAPEEFLFHLVCENRYVLFHIIILRQILVHKQNKNTEVARENTECPNYWLLKQVVCIVTTRL